MNGFMTDRYDERRAELVADVHRQLRIHCKLNARARIRKIADLDYEHKGIDREVTKELFNYYDWQGEADVYCD